MAWGTLALEATLGTGLGVGLAGMQKAGLLGKTVRKETHRGRRQTEVSEQSGAWGGTVCGECGMKVTVVGRELVNRPSTCRDYATVSPKLPLPDSVQSKQLRKIPSSTPF